MEASNFHLFRIVEDANEVFEGAEDVQFHLFPTKILPKLTDYVKFLLRLQANFQNCQECVLVDDIEIYKGDFSR